MPVLLAAPAGQATGRVASVTDGDTFRLASGERIRISGIDAPETQPRQAKCHAEIARGNTATRQARTLLAGRSVLIERVGRSYNRTVANVRLDNRGVAAELVRIGAARWWSKGRPRPDWCRP